ncbi:AAA family ATPase [Candidatus Micrarchaeota archaeon]|nr:AAA family ATPase [Candidatus Micrarchaeota archaeon]
MQALNRHPTYPRRYSESVLEPGATTRSSNASYPPSFSAFPVASKVPPKAIASNPDIELTEEFVLALHKLEKGSGHVLLTGKAGTGKSTLLAKFRSETRKKVAVVAPTGIAALNVRGETIHSFFKFKPDVHPDKVKKVSAKRRAAYALLDTLVIDEASMVRADLFDCVEKFLRLNGRDGSKPFGGVQVILVGDLYQLPPVLVSGEREAFKARYASEYFFDSEAFRKAEFERVELEKVHRQKDAAFLDILNAIRNNTLSDEQLALLNERVQAGLGGGLDVTLTTVNRVADEINQRNLELLPGRLYRSDSFISGRLDVQPAPQTLNLKVGCQVMMLNNDVKGRWVNGSMGKVTAFFTDEEGKQFVRVRLEDGNAVDVPKYKWDVSKQVLDVASGKIKAQSIGSCVQFPMRLAWALTIHKSQGKTFDRVRLDLTQGTFAPGQLYVALSRCRSLEGITLEKPVEKRHAMVDDRVVKFMNGQSAPKPVIEMGFVPASKLQTPTVT